MALSVTVESASLQCFRSHSFILIFFIKCVQKGEEKQCNEVLCKAQAIIGWFAIRAILTFDDKSRYYILGA